MARILQSSIPSPVIVPDALGKPIVEIPSLESGDELKQFLQQIDPEDLRAENAERLRPLDIDSSQFEIIMERLKDSEYRERLIRILSDFKREANESEAEFLKRFHEHRIIRLIMTTSFLTALKLYSAEHPKDLHNVYLAFRELIKRVYPQNKKTP